MYSAYQLYKGKAAGRQILELALRPVELELAAVVSANSRSSRSIIEYHNFMPSSSEKCQVKTQIFAVHWCSLLQGDSASVAELA